MQFFSIYDLIFAKALEKGLTTEDTVSFFRVHNIKKTQLFSLQQTSYIPHDAAFQKAIEDFLGMTSLEIELAMGRVPTEYRKSFFCNISNIAKLLEKEQAPDEKAPYKPYFVSGLGALYQGDCIEIMKTIPDCSVDLVFADPPFNLGKEYDPGINDNMTMTKYINWTYTWLDECVRILKPGGRIFVYNLPKWCTYIAAYLSQSLTFWDWIAIDMKLNLPIPNKLYPAHYALVSFFKGSKANTFHSQRIPMQTCRYCGGEIKDYGGYKSKMNPFGINVSDIWSDIYPVRHKNSKNRKYNELSVKLLDRIISMATNEGDVVFDPFGGSGTTFAVAEILKRKWVGCELGDCETIKHRLLNPSQDEEQLKKIRENSNCLFTASTKKLRKKNGFWVCGDFRKGSEESTDNQLVLDLCSSGGSYNSAL